MSARDLGGARVYKMSGDRARELSVDHLLDKLLFIC